MKIKYAFKVFWMAILVVFVGGFAVQARVSLERESEITLSQEVAVSRWVILNNATTIGIAQNAILAIHQGEVERFPIIEGLVVKTGVAPNRQYWAAMRIFPLPPTDRHPRRVWLTIYNAQLKEESRVPLSIPYDAPLPEFAVNNNGQVMVVYRETATFVLYSRTGVKLKEGKLFARADYDLERIVYLSPVGATNGFLLAATHHGMTVNRNMEPELLQFEGKGNMKWRKKISADAIGQLAVSPQGQFNALATYSFKGQQIVKSSRIFNRAGEPLLNVEVLFKTATFSHDEAQVFLADNEEAYMVNVQEKEVAWHKHLADPGAMITAAVFDPSNPSVFVLIARNKYENGRFQFVDPKLVVLNEVGEVVDETAFPGKAFLKPALYFDPEQKYLQIGFTHSIQKLKVSQ